MPLILAPYTLGSQLAATGAAATGGAAYYRRKKRYMAYILTGLLLVLAL